MIIIKFLLVFITVFLNINCQIHDKIKTIAFVVDQYGKTTNGCISFVKEWTRELIKRGYNIRIICGEGTSEYGEEIYETGSKKRGLINKKAKEQGMAFAKTDDKIIENALQNVDVVHFITQFDLSKRVKKYCDKNNITTTATFATLPHNVASASGLPCKSMITSITNRKWRKFFNKFKHCNSISKVVDAYLKKEKYKPTLHMFYHGVNNNFKKKIFVNKPKKYDDKFIIITVGRLSNEKKHDLIINAIANSKYKDKIKLIIAGGGPNKNKLEKLIKKNKVDCEINFYTRDELIDVLNISNLYIHAADIEAMGMSAIEAICCGVVPIINNSEYSGTKEFALSDKNLFNFNDYQDLAKKIDYFIENKDKFKRQSKEYIDISYKYRIEKNVDNLLEMMNIAFNEDHKSQQD